MRECTEIELLYNSNYFPQYRYNGNQFHKEQQVAIGKGKTLVQNRANISSSQGEYLFLSKTLFFKCPIYHFISINQKISENRLCVFTDMSL